MIPYDSMAMLYDEFMEDVPYDQWAERIVSILKSHGLQQGRILELACGTGKMTEHLLNAGYFVTGVDQSEEMLMQAQSNLGSFGNRLKLTCNDMAEYRSAEHYNAVVCVCDGINYMDSKEKLSKLFASIAGMCYPGAVFVFDISTAFKFETLLADQIIAESNEENAFIWSNDYDPETRILEFDFTLFVKEGQLFKRYTEHHRQRAHNIDELQEIGHQSGFNFEGCFNEYQDMPCKKDSERVHLIFTFGGQL